MNEVVTCALVLIKFDVSLLIYRHNKSIQSIVSRETCLKERNIHHASNEKINLF